MYQDVDKYLATAAALKAVTPEEIRGLPKSTSLSQSTKVKLLGLYISHATRQPCVPLQIDGTQVLYFTFLIIDKFKAVGVFNGRTDQFALSSFEYNERRKQLFNDHFVLANKQIPHEKLIAKVKPALIALKRPITRWVKYHNGLVTFDPDVYARALTVTTPSDSASQFVLVDLEDQYKLASQIYHSGVGESKLKDKEFDRLKDLILEYDPQNKTVKVVGAPVVHSQDKVQLPHPMGSLEKCKPGEKGAKSILNWFAKLKAPQYVESIKIDGLSCQLIYEKGKLVAAYTRGDGLEGKPILQHVTHIKGIPLKLKSVIDLAVRAELVMRKSVFSKKYSKTVNKSGFENARNAIAGITNRKQPALDILQDCDCIAFSILNQDDVDKSVQLDTLKKQGFNVVPYTVFSPNRTIEDTLIKKLEDTSKSYDYDADGRVVEVDSARLRNKLGTETNSLNPAFARAFKNDSDDDVVQSEVTLVAWDVSKDGYLKPVVHIKPVRTGGVTVEHLSLIHI